MNRRHSKLLVLLGLAIAMAFLCALSSCAQESPSESSADAAPTEQQASEQSQPSKKKNAMSFLDTIRGAGEAVKEKAEGAANAVSEAKQDAERKFADWQEERRKEAAARTEKALEDAELTCKSKTLEYSDKKAKPLKLVECSDRQIDVSSKGKVDRSTPGTKKVTYTLELDGQTVQRTVKFKIRDTKPPRIDFADTEPKVDLGADYDPAKNVNFVKDPVDGNLSLVDTAPKAKGSKAGAERFYDKGWYTVKGDVDTSTPGVYTIDVDAADVNGNTSHRSFDVTVVAPEPEPSESSAFAPESTYTDRTVYVTASGHKYHWAGCQYLKSSCIPMSLSEAESQNYEPCKRCIG